LSELQLALLAIAALLLLALYISGKWQERRLLRRLRERLRDRLHTGLGDPLLRVEPNLGGPAGPLADDELAPVVPVRRPAREPIRPGLPPAPAGPASELDTPMAGGRRTGLDAYADGGAYSPAAAGVDPRADSRADAGADADPGLDTDPDRDAGHGAEEGYTRRDDHVSSEALPLPAALLRPDWAEDPLLDCSLEIRFARAMDGVSVIDAAAALGHADWSLPVHFVVWDGRSEQWVLPDRFGYYTDALASLQMANRRAVLGVQELARFVQMVQQVAAALDADVDLPDIDGLVKQARALEQLCARFDIRIELTVLGSGKSWTGPQVRSAAQQAGFIALAGPVQQGQRWARYDGQGDVLFVLFAVPDAQANSLNRLTLQLDIGRVAESAQAFAEMADSAQMLAAALGARVVDDNGNPIEARSVVAIESQLAGVYADMRAEGIEPGSARARRLYV